MRRNGIALVLMLCLLLTACDQFPSASPGGADAGGVLNVCSSGETNPLDPQSKADKAFFDLLYEPLFMPDGQFAPQCILAESYTFSGNLLTVSLRPDLFFSDGTTLDATDVIQTVKTLQEHPEYVYASALEGVSGISAPDAHTVVFTMETADAFLVEKLTFPILPSEKQTTLYPAGSGPYRLDSAAQNEHLFEINEYYRSEAPLICNVRLHILPDAETVRYAYRSGTVDVLYTQARRISDYSGVSSTAYAFESMKYTFVGYRADHPLLQHRPVRQAIAQAVDRQKLVDDVLMGYGTVTTTPFQPNHYRFADLFEAPTVHVDAAKETLEQCLNALEEPVDPAFTLLVNGDDAASVNVGVSLSTMLSACGLTVTVEEVPFDTYCARVAESTFDAYLGQVDFFSTADAARLITPMGGMNYGGYQNEQVETLFSNLRVAINETAFHNAAKALTDFFDREQPLLSICFEQDLLMSKDTVLGEKTPMPEHPFFGVTGWHRQ